MKRFIALAVMLAVAPFALAQTGGMDTKKEKKAAQGTVHKASGKVTKVDPAKGALTIAHGPVASLKWPSMTMSFKVRDKALLGKVKPGDQIEFSFVESGRDHTITEIK